PLGWWLSGGSGLVALGMPVVMAPMAALALWSLPVLALGQARLSAALLTEPASARLAARVAELTESRAGALAVHGAELRRIERDLHDGAQAQLVALALRLGLAERRLSSDPDLVKKLVREAREGAETAMTELRGLVRGLYPPVLADRGLAEAVGALAARSPLPVAVELGTLRQLPAAVEAAAYFTVAEALTNIAKHARAATARIVLGRDHDFLVLEIHDDGIGGADESRGTGLCGIRRRVSAFDGRLVVCSPFGGPTVLTVHLPCAG
ncbi:MAG: sensor histidine kinase, partial [Dactylosporangium sp.]|nr:sensor histidine kinase [Dactylosporangium sp.]NNJ61337.1 sensor histidine kinase [Dactylosporangium sp.]